MTVHELSLTCTRRSGQGPNRYKDAHGFICPAMRSNLTEMAYEVKHAFVHVGHQYKSEVERKLKDRLGGAYEG
jgi:hypothetical protein